MTFEDYQELSEAAAMGECFEMLLAECHLLNDGRACDGYWLHLSGKDADLEPAGGYGIVEVNKANDESATFTVRSYATFCPPCECPETRSEKRKMRQAQEIVRACSLPMEWTGDDWFSSDEYEVVIPWVTGSDGAVDYKATAEALLAAASTEVEDFRALAVQLNKALDSLCPDQ